MLIQKFFQSFFAIYNLIQIISANTQTIYIVWSLPNNSRRLSRNIQKLQHFKQIYNRVKLRTALKHSFVVPYELLQVRF